MMKFAIASAAALSAVASAASAVDVNSLTTVNVDTFSGPTTPGTWYAEVRPTAAGTASIVDLTGVGGNLETNAPNGSGVVRLTSTPSAGGGNNDKAAVTTYGSFGPAATGLLGLNASYSYYKAASLENTAAAPAFRVQLNAVGGTGDNFGALVYEPYWQMPTDPTPNSWTTATITPTSGLFWWNGGFEQASSAGGPPLHTLTEWAALFAGSDAVDFASASIISYSTGIGSFNPGQTMYVDNIAFSTPTFDGGTSNFIVPEPTTLAAVAAGAVVLLGRRRRRA